MKTFKLLISAVLLSALTLNQVNSQDVFYHLTNKNNITGHITTMDHPGVNGQAGKLLFITQRYGKYNDHQVGIYYTGERWGIYNEDRAAMPENTMFNVLAVDPSDRAFQHQSKKSNIVNNWTVIDHPKTNNNPNAVILVTQHWKGTYNTKPIGVWYTSDGKWAIFNQDRSAMTEKVNFNVLVLDEGANSGVRGALAELHTASENHYITKTLEPNINALVFVTQNFKNRGQYNNHFPSVWYSPPTWTIYNQDRKAITTGAMFNVVTFNSGGKISKQDLVDNTDKTGKVTLWNKGMNKVVNVYDNLTREGDPVKTLGPGQQMEVSCKIGDVFTFELVGEKGSSIVPNFTVYAFDITHELAMQERFSEARTRYQRIANGDASRHSFDLLKIDPIFIDYTKDDKIKNKKNGQVIGEGGMRRQIFANLADSDVDWTPYDGDIALKNQFSLKVLDELDATQTTEMHYSAQSFKESYGANIGVSGGKEGAAKAGGSASFNYSTEESKSNKNIYTFSRSEAKVYAIKLEKDHIDLTEEFKNAVKSLPRPTRVPSSLTQARNTAGFSSYKRFMNDWGTHYPDRTWYGGVNMMVMSITEDQFMESKGWGIDLKGEAEKKVKVETGFSYSQNKTFEEMNAKSKTIEYAKGGSGSGGGWSVDMGNAQPVNIELSRLHELIQVYYFKDGSSENDLAGRRAMLQYAIEDYIGSATDAGTSLKPRIFRISDVQWKMISPEDGATTPHIYGKLQIKVVKDNGITALETKTVWNRSDAGGSRVIADKNYVEKCEGEIVFSVPAEKGRIDLSKYAFQIFTNLMEYDVGLNPDDFIANRYDNIYFKDIPVGGKTFTVNIKSEDSDIDVSARVEEIKLGFEF